MRNDKWDAASAEGFIDNPETMFSTLLPRSDGKKLTSKIPFVGKSNI
jgi:hypothetical protein